MFFCASFNIYMSVLRLAIFKPVHFYAFSIITVALNKSPSTVISKTPFISLTRSLAIASPRPLPSVFLDSSPRLNLSISSSAEIFRGAPEMFFYFEDHHFFTSVLLGSVSLMSIYTLLLSMAYFDTLPNRFSSTLHISCPSAMI